MHSSTVAARALVAALLCTCCTSDSSPDALVTADASSAAPDAVSIDAISPADASADTARPNDAHAILDAAFEDADWGPFPGIAPECATRLARDPERAVGAWSFEPCGPVAGCQALRQHSFADRVGEQIGFELVDGERIVAGGAIDVPDGRRVDLFFLRRAGGVDAVARSVYFAIPDESTRAADCRISDVAIRGADSMVVVDDFRDVHETLTGARYPIIRALGDSEWYVYATLTNDGLTRNYPQHVAFSRELAADQVATSNRIVSVLPDGVYRFTEPAPPYDGVRVHSEPVVVGEYWIASGRISGVANGLFMSHLGEPSLRVRGVDEVGQVVADETDIVWLEGSRLTDGVRLDDAAIWRAPWRPGPIDPAEARLVRAIPEVAQLFPGSLSPGSAYLPLRLGGGYVATRNGMATSCHVIRLSDGAMATFAPPGYRCQRVLAVSATEAAFSLVEEADTAGTSQQLWFVPISSLTFEP